MNSNNLDSKLCLMIRDTASNDLVSLFLPQVCFSVFITLCCENQPTKILSLSFPLPVMLLVHVDLVQTFQIYLHLHCYTEIGNSSFLVPLLSFYKQYINI